MHSWIPRINHLLTNLLAATFFFVPLVMWPATSEVFEFNKMLLVYLLTSLIGTLTITKWIFQKRLDLKRTPLDLPIFLFLLGQLLSTIFSINPHTSLWGYYSRFHGGLGSTVAYAMLYYALANHLLIDDLRVRHQRFSTVILAILASATLVSVYGILEHLGIDKNVWVQDVQNRVFSTLGQPNWLSAYLTALLPLPIYLALKSTKKTNFLIYSLLAITFFLTTLFTKSRSGIGTSLIILLLILFHQLINLTKSAQKTVSKTTLLLPFLLLFIIFLVGTPWTPNPKQISQRLSFGGPLWPEVESYLNQVHLSTKIKPLEVSRLSITLQESLKLQESGKRIGGSDSFDIRRVVWQGAIDLFKRRPILGTGLETFGYSYYWTRPAAHNLLSEWDFLYNKAHNEYLNFLATTGLLGFISYLILIIFTLKTLFLTFRNTQANPFPPAFLFGFISILITNYFGFSVVPVALFFFTLPILSLASTETILKEFTFNLKRQLTKKQQKKSKIKHLPPLFVTFLILLLLGQLFIFKRILYRFLADLNYNKGRQYLNAGYISESLPLLQKATQLHTHEPVFKSSLAEAYAFAALATNQQLNAATPSAQNAGPNSKLSQQRDQYAALALETIDQTLNLNPWHLNFLKSKAKIELTLATFEPQFYQRSIHSLLKAISLAPTDAKLYFNVAIIYEETGQNDSALAAYYKSLELKPDYQQARVELINLLIKEKRINEAKQELPHLLNDFPNHPLKQTLK